LVGLARFFENDETDPSLMVEACENGWWYTAGLPGGKRVAGCITDADLAHRMKLGETEQWQRSLASAPAVSFILRHCEPCSPVVARSTASHRLDPAATERWLAVGDAASRFDPLSSQGITKALRSGIFASYAIGDWLVRADSGGLRRYQQYLADEFKSYSEVRVKYYQQEQRWPASDFWRRRHEAGSAYTTKLAGAMAG
jgi:flavin-dependent dehydrogenase